MKKERNPIKVSISNVEDMETIEKEIKNLKLKEVKVLEEDVEYTIAKINNQIKQILPATLKSEYEKNIIDNYSFLESLNRTDKSYELVENSFDIYFRNVLYEGIIASVSDKDKAIEIYNSNPVNKLMKDINEYVSSMLHLTGLQTADSRTKAYFTKLLQHICTSMTFFYNVYNLDTKHKSYNDITQYLLSFMSVNYPVDGKTV